MLLDALRDNFSRMKRSLAENILLAVECMIRCASCNSSKVVRELCLLNGKSFKTNDMLLYRLLDHQHFQIDDRFWRCYITSVFQILIEQGEITKDKKVLINVDFTSDRDNFLILCASVLLGVQEIPLYFSMRTYPKRKNQYNHTKMETAFIKALRHILSDKYHYVLVADRGFGNDRFIQLCLTHGFEILIRIEPNMSIKTGEKQGIVEETLTDDGVYECYVRAWKTDHRILRHSHDGKVWYLLTNINDITDVKASEGYAKRFRIAKVFQNLKSSGFDIEKSKIKKYDRFKRMLFLSCFAYSILVLLGKFVQEKLPGIKKNSPICLNLFIASSSLACLPFLATHNKPIQS